MKVFLEDQLLVRQGGVMICTYVRSYDTERLKFRLFERLKLFKYGTVLLSEDVS